MESIGERNTRTREDVCEILNLTTIKESELNNITQCLYPMQDDNADNLILVEANEHILEAIDKGDTVSFHGNKHDSAVLCTKNCTYDIKEVEISNSWLLIPNLKMGKAISTSITERIIERRDIKKIFTSYLEVKETKPNLANLFTLLKPSSFNGLEYESLIDSTTLYSWNRLQNELQVSEHELEQAVAEFLIADIDGYLRLISFDVETRSLNLILDYFGEQSWEIDEINKESTYECVKELIHKPVFDIIFKKYTEISTKSKSDGSPLYRYDERKCCIMIAKVFLGVSPVIEYKKFMESWNIGSPEKMQPREEYLYGSALIIYNATKMQKEVVSYPEASLPNNIHGRLNELFKIKAKWTIEEITPYITRFTKDKMHTNALLMRHARCSTQKGIKYYSSKHGN